MKKYVFLVIVLVCLFYYALGDDPYKMKIIRVGTECDYPPNNWEEDKATSSNVPLENKKGFYAEGYDIQIAKVVAEKMGAKLEVKKIAWQDLLPALNRREIDAIFSGMLPTSERKEYATFSETYEFQEEEYVILIHKESRYAEAKKLNDFYGAILTGQKDTALDDAVNQIPGAIHLEPADSFSELIDKLISYDIDGIVINLDSAKIYEQSHPELIAVRFPKGLGFVLEYQGACAAVRKKDVKLLKEINNILSGLSKRDRQRIMDRTISRQWNNL